jgi:hypothetical protein
MEPEIEQLWNLTKESHPDAVVFLRTGDLYFLRGADVETVKDEFGIRCFGTSVGFDTEQSWYFMRELAKRGHAVLRAERSGVRPVSANGHRPQTRPPRGRFIALEPALLFEVSGLSRMRPEERPYEVFCDLLVRNDMRGLREHGELYVFEFDNSYEIDWELSSMLPSRAFILGRAALDTKQKVPCRLVLPRAWRGRSKRKLDKLQRPQPVQFGQMPFKFD